MSENFMGYHVYISNKDIKGSGKIINSFDNLRIFLEENFKINAHFDHDGFLYFYTKNPSELMIFYDFSNLYGGTLWVKNPEVSHINLLIKIARNMQDGSYVHGDDGEIYQDEIDEYFNSYEKENYSFELRYRLIRKVLP